MAEIENKQFTQPQEVVGYMSVVVPEDNSLVDRRLTAPGLQPPIPGDTPETIATSNRHRNGLLKLDHTPKQI